MKLLVSAILLSLLLVQFTNLRAQTDTSFWFAAPWVSPDNTWRDDVKLHLSTFSAITTTVRVRQPSATAPNRYDTTIVIPAYTTFDYVFWRDKLASPTNFGFDSLETRPANSVVPYGFYISSSSDITAVYDVITRAPVYGNPETFSLKGRNALGKEFLCPFQTQWINQTMNTDLNGDGLITQPKQQISIVATQSNTTVWITPRCAIVGHAANITYSVLLQYPGSAYTVENAVQSTTVSGQSLAGTAITSDKPVGVTVADDSVKGNGGCYDLMGDQIVPVTVIGKEYMVIKGEMNTAEPEGTAILAKDNNTQLIINDGITITTATLNAGDTYHYPTTQAVTYITSNNYVYVLHVTGFGCELGEDLVPPVNCSGSNLVSFSRTNSQKLALNILCCSSALNSFTLNGSTSLVAPVAFTMVPGTSALSGGPYFGAHISFSTSTLPVGSYTIGNNTDAFALAVLEGGVVTGAKYHYASSFMYPTAVKAATLADLCVHTSNTVALTGTVSGASSTGIWTTAGTGSFSPVYSSSVTVVSTIYTLSATDTLLSAIKFYLVSAGNCRPVSDSIILNLHHKPGIITSANATLCKNNLSPVVLSGTVTNASGGVWSGGNGGTYTGSGTSVTYSFSAADLSASAVIFTLTSQSPLAGCTNSAKTLTVNLTDPPVVNSGSDIVVCSKTASSVSLYGNITGITTSGTWTGNGSGGFMPSANSSTVNYVFGASDYLSTSFMFTLTSTNNLLCASVSDVVQVFRDTSSVHIHTSSNPVCANQSVTLTASGTPAFLWNTGSASSLLVVSPPGTTAYTVQGTSTLNCSYIATISLAVNPLPPVLATTSRSFVCRGESLILNVTGASNYTWTTIPAYTSSVTVSPSVTTIYFVTGTDNNGCKNSDSVSVSVSVCTGIDSQSEDLLQIYPNPTSGEFVILSAKNVSLRLIDQLGQLVKTIELNEENHHKLCINDLTGGVYFLTGIFNEKPVKRKIIIDK